MNMPAGANSIERPPAFVPRASPVAANHAVIARRLASAGLWVFPIDIETKKPMPGFRWSIASTRDPEATKDLWAGYPNAGVAIDLAKSGLVVIDCDRHGGPDGVAAFQRLVSAHPPFGFGVPQVATAGGGLHYYFRNVDNNPIGNSRGSLPSGIDVRGAGGYVVAPGIIRLDGSAWRHADGAPDVVDAFARGSIPRIPDWLAYIVRANNVDATRATPVPVNAVPSVREQGYARAALESECRRVARSLPGERNNALNGAAFAAGKLVGANWIERTECEAALTEAAGECGLLADDGPPQVRKTISSGLRKGQMQPRPPLSSRSALEMFPEHTLSPSPGGVIALPIARENLALNRCVEAVSDPLSGFVFDGDAKIEPPRLLVSGLLPYVGIGFIGGRSGAGKTYLMIDLAVSLATGEPFFGRKVREQIGVAIFAGEGSGTIAARLQAAKISRGVSEALPISWLGAVPNLADRNEICKMIVRLRALDAEMRTNRGIRLGAVFFDTLAAIFDLDDENDNAEAAKTIKLLRWLSDEIRAVMIPVHHYGKGQETGLRGASGWRAGCDAILSVTCDRNELSGKSTNRKLSLAKSRDAEEGPVGAFSLNFRALGTDQDGEPFGNCYVSAESLGEGASAGERSERLPRAAQAYLDALELSIAKKGVTVSSIGKDGRDVLAVDREDIRQAFYGRCFADGDTEKRRHDAKRKQFGRAENAAVDRKLVECCDVAGKTMVWPIEGRKFCGTRDRRDTP